MADHSKQPDIWSLTQKKVIDKTARFAYTLMLKKEKWIPDIQNKDSDIPDK